MRSNFNTFCFVAIAALIQFGCAKHQHRPSITAFGLSPGNRCDPPGIPYYLPKPLLVVSKNFHHIDESKVGLTGPVPVPNGFDNQAAYADIKSNVTVPVTNGGASTAVPAANVNATALSNAAAGQPTQQAFIGPSVHPSVEADGLQPDSFFTYQIIFVPDLSQKYGLQITGGAGEFRAAMNMVNGWMYTGMGPFYLKDSSSAQNAMATGVAAMYAGRAASDVIDSVGNLTESIGSLTQESGGQKALESQTQEFLRAVEALDAVARTAPKVPSKLLNFAEIYIYEPILLPDQSTEWRLVAEHRFDRDYLDTVDTPEAASRRTEIMGQLLQLAMSRPPCDPQKNVENRNGNSATGPQNESGGSTTDIMHSPNPLPSTAIPPATNSNSSSVPAIENTNDVNINLLPAPAHLKHLQPAPGLNLFNHHFNRTKQPNPVIQRSVGNLSVSLP